MYGIFIYLSGFSGGAVHQSTSPVVPVRRVEDWKDDGRPPERLTPETRAGRARLLCSGLAGEAKLDASDVSGPDGSPSHRRRGSEGAGVGAGVG